MKIKNTNIKIFTILEYWKLYILSFLCLMFFSSCSQINVSQWNRWSIYSLFGLMIICFITLFYIILKVSRQEKYKMRKYISDISKLLNNCSNDNEKIKALNILIDRIQTDPRYEKNKTWKNKVLIKTYGFLSSIYYKNGDTKNTINICSKIINIDPTDYLIYANRGSLYLNQGDYNKAIVDLTKSIELNNSFADSYNNRGKAYSHSGNSEKAIEDYKSALYLKDTAITEYNLGKIFFDLGRKEECETHLKRVIVLCDKEDIIEEDKEYLLSHSNDMLLKLKK